MVKGRVGRGKVYRKTRRRGRGLARPEEAREENAGEDGAEEVLAHVVEGAGAPDDGQQLQDLHQDAVERAEDGGADAAAPGHGTAAEGPEAAGAEQQVAGEVD